jgi:hypothetical protein
MTPLPIIDLVRLVLGHIDLDPASSAAANLRVRAREWYGELEDGLANDWFGAVYCNPPGGKRGNKSMTFLFWEKLMTSAVEHAIFMFFSLEGLSVSQGRTTPGATRFMTCVPRKRIRFDYPDDSVVKTAPSHANCIVYVPGTRDVSSLFAEAFSELGDIVVPYQNGPKR